MATAVVATQGREADPKDVLRLCFSMNIDDAEVRRLMEIAAGPSELARQARLSLMSAFRTPRAVRVAQVRWFIENEPRTFLGDHAWLAVLDEGNVPGADYERMRACWLSAVREHPSDLTVAANAAWFMIQFDAMRGAELLFAHARSTGSRAAQKRAAFYLAEASDRHADESASLAAKALDAGARFLLEDENAAENFELIATVRACGRRGTPTTAASDLLKRAEQAAMEWREASTTHRAHLNEVVREAVRAVLTACAPDEP